MGLGSLKNYDGPRNEVTKTVEKDEEWGKYFVKMRNLRDHFVILVRKRLKWEETKVVVTNRFSGVIYLG